MRARNQLGAAGYSGKHSIALRDAAHPIAWSNAAWAATEVEPNVKAACDPQDESHNEQPLSPSGKTNKTPERPRKTAYGRRYSLRSPPHHRSEEHTSELQSRQ